MKSLGRRFILFAFVLGVASLFWVTCTTNEVNDPLGIGNFNQIELSGLTNSAGIERTTFYTYETIMLTIDGLIPLEQTHIEIVKGCDECQETIKRSVVVTDKNGAITNLPVWYHVGVDQDGNRVDQSGNYGLYITQPPKHDPWTILMVCFDVVNDISPEPQVHAFDGAGTFKGQTALVGEDVYLQGFNVTADSVRLYVIPKQIDYADGDPFVDVSGGFEWIAPASGTIPETLVWGAAGTVGSYDCIVDLRPFGEYNVGDVVSDMNFTGLAVQNPPGAEHIIADIACDESGVHKDVFDDLEPLFATVDPPTRSADLLTWMSELAHWLPVFVMPHREIWQQDEQLVTIRTVGTHQMPSYIQVNPMSGSVGLFRLRGECKPLYLQPMRLWPGDYDIIVDVNRNFLYDPGIDILDGGSQVGFSIVTEEDTPPVRLINTADEDFIGRRRNTSRLWAHFVRDDNSPIAGITVKFTKVLGPGSVAPTTAVTDEYGMAHTVVSGVQYGEMTRVRTEAVVDDSLHYNVVSFYRLIPCSHDQGHGQGSGGL